MTIWSAGAIVGIGETSLGKLPRQTAVDLQTEAVRLALADAGLARDDVDGLLSLGPYSNPSMMFAAGLGEHLGLRTNYQSTVDAGGILTPMAMAFTALAAIDAGLCHTVVCVFGDPALTGRKAAGRGMTSTADGVEFEEPFGLVGTVVPYSLLADNRMHRYGTTEEDLGLLAVTARDYASRRDNAYRRNPMTLDDYFASPMIASPLRLFDCSSIVDGAGAFVITSTDRAADARHDPVFVRSLATDASHRNVGQFPDWEDLQLRPLAQRALARAGAVIDDIDVAQIHDAYTISLAAYLEELGFCERGELGGYLRDGHIAPGGACPVNTHGGLLSQGHVGGMLHMTEAVLQLRGTAGRSQVPGAHRAMVAGGGGIFGANAVMVLESE